MQKKMMHSPEAAVKGPSINEVGDREGGGVKNWSKLPTDSTKKLPTWRRGSLKRGCQKSGKNTDVVYGWSQTFLSPTGPIFGCHACVEIAICYVVKTKFVHTTVNCHCFLQGWRKVWKSGAASNNAARWRCRRHFLSCQNFFNKENLYFLNLQLNITSN